MVLLHGFTQTGASWGPFVEEISRHHRTVKLDLPGHGHSSRVVADLPQAARLAVEAGGAGAYLGYSMGARIALRAALDHPETVSKLVLVSGSPGIADPDERAARRRDDEELAASITDVEEFLDRWLATPMFASLPASAAQRASRLSNTADGLASSLRNCGVGSQEPLWDRLGELEMPVLLISGEADPKYCRIASQMASAIPSAELAVVAGAGHAVHMERPVECAALVADFLAAD